MIFSIMGNLMGSKVLLCLVTLCSAEKLGIETGNELEGQDGIGITSLIR